MSSFLVDSSKLLCCFNNFTASCLEITIVIVSIVGLIFTIWGLGTIPWGFVNEGIEVLYIFSLMIIILSLLSVAIIIILRAKRLINEKHNKIAKILAMIISIFSIFFFIFSIIICCCVLQDLKFWDEEIPIVDRDEETGELKEIETTGEGQITDSEWIFSSITTIIPIFVWLFLIFLWISDWIRINIKDSGTFQHYIKKNKKKQIGTINGNNSKFVGYDENGNPIYSSQPKGANNNITNITMTSEHPELDQSGQGSNVINEDNTKKNISS